MEISFNLGMSKKPVELTAKELEHITRLRQRPDLMERFASILDLSDAGQGALKTADEVEALLIEEVRKLGNATMTEWATSAESRVGADHQKANPGTYCGKKNG